MSSEGDDDAPSTIKGRPRTTGPLPRPAGPPPGARPAPSRPAPPAGDDADDVRAGARILEALGELVEARVGARVSDVARRAEGAATSKVGPIIEEKLAEALEPKLKAFEAKLKTFAQAPSGREVAEREIEKRVTDLSASIESAAAARAIDAVQPAIADVVAEKLKALENKLASKVRDLVSSGEGGGKGAPDPAAIEKAVEAALAERLPELEKKLAAKARSSGASDSAASEEKIEELVAEKVRALEAKLSGKVAALVATSAVGKSSSSAAAPDTAALEAKLQELVAERAKALETKLTKAIDAKARELSERLDELAEAAEKAEKKGGGGSVAAPTGADLEAVADKVAQLIPSRVAKILAEDVGVLISRDVARLVPEKVANNLNDALEAVLPEKLAEILPGEVAAALAENPPAAGGEPDLDELEERLTKTLEAKVKSLLESKAGKSGTHAVSLDAAGEIAAAVAQTAEFKETIDKKFRAMLMHVESDVVPRVVTRKLSASAEGGSGE